MEVFIFLIGLFLFIGGLIWFYASSGFSQQVSSKKEQEEKIYVQKDFMTQTELTFYNKLRELEIEYKIVPQVNLATVVRKISKGYINELFKNIDFAIFDNNYKKLLLLIELNDDTHNNIDRRDRDLKVRKICNDAGIKLITFHTKYPNEKDYILNRIRKELVNNSEQN